MRTHRALWTVLLAVGAGSGIVFGQNSGLGQYNPVDPTSTGVHLYGVSVFGSYYNGDSPIGLPVSINSPYGAGSGSNVVTGASATFGYSTRGANSSASIVYSPSYVAFPDHPDYDTLNHSLSMNWRRKLGTKWTITAGASGVISDQNSLLFNPTLFDNLVSTPATFEDLAGAMLTGTYTNTQLASILTGAPLSSSPESTYLFGSRVMSASVRTSLSYAVSGRSAINLNVTGTRYQSLKSPGESTGSEALPQSTGGSASLTWSYSLSSRTNVSVGVSTSAMMSKLVNQEYSESANLSIGRTLSNHWFAQASAGAGILTANRTTYRIPGGPQYQVSGSIGYKTRAHSFMASVSRSFGDAYGIGAASTLSATGAWNWRRPGSAWATSASVGYMQLQDSAIANGSSWTAVAMFSRALSAHLSMSAQYGYYRLPAYGMLLVSNLSENGMSVSLRWSPAARRYEQTNNGTGDRE